MPSAAACSNKGVILMKNLEEESEEDFYSEKILGEYVENDEIDSLEEGFMIGYLG